MLSQKAQDTLTEFAAVKKADVQLQTQLGNRQGQIAANIIGAFADSQSHAFGWQMRVYGGENDSKGANAGIFFRRLDGESLYGINTFADYEKGDYGEFLRYGIGGELQNRYASFAMNYYLPITDDKHNGSTVAFSQKGYDANLRINIPQLDFLKVRADYYHYSGEYGIKDDNGFRYGLEIKPIDNLRIGAYYDDGGEKFGGNIAYVYNIAAPAKRESKVVFSPDLFSPIVREYSQRIMTAQLGPQLRFITTAISVMTSIMITPERAFTTAMTMAGMTTIITTETPTMTATRMASAYFTVVINPRNNDHFSATTVMKHLISFPPVADRTTPLVITTRRSFFTGESFDLLIVGSTLADFRVAGGWRFRMPVANYTITITEGSEDFISVGITLTTENTTTVPHIITETPKNSAAKFFMRTLSAKCNNHKRQMHNGRRIYSPPYPANIPSGLFRWLMLHCLRRFLVHLTIAGQLALLQLSAR